MKPLDDDVGMRGEDGSVAQVPQPSILDRLTRLFDEPTGLHLGVPMLVAVILAIALVGYFNVSLTQPGALSGDHLLYLSMARSYIDGNGLNYDHQLGFPGVQDWRYFPNFDLSYRCVMWILSRFSRNPFFVVHALYLVGVGAMACACFWTLRRLGLAGWLAIPGTLASVVTPYFNERVYLHDALALSISVPFGFGLALLVAQEAGRWCVSRWIKDPFVIVAIVVVGVSGLYYAFYSLLIIAFAATCGAILNKSWAPLIAALLTCAAVFAFLIFSGYGLDLPRVLGGAIKQPVRYAWEQLGYGLNLAAAAHQFQFIPGVRAKLEAAQAAIPGDFDFYGDGGAWPAPPLTLAILASPLLAVAGASAWTTTDSRAQTRLRLLFVSALIIIFLLMFGARGGIGYLFNLIVAPQIRSDARVMPFLTFGAVVALAILARLARDSGRPLMRSVAPTAVVCFLLASAVGSAGGAFIKQNRLAGRQDDQALQHQLKALVAARQAAHLSTILELPIVAWPELAPPYPAPGYEPSTHQLPYIFDEPRSGVRWSYGAAEAQPSFAALTAVTANMNGLTNRARRLGFDGLLIEKRAYRSGDLASLQTVLKSDARLCDVYDDDRFALYRLNKAAVSAASAPCSASGRPDEPAKGQ